MGDAKIIEHPCLFIIGTQKGGTTSMYRYLSNDSRFSLGAQKEMGFLSIDALWNKGGGWYLKQFSKKGLLKKKVLMDATPEYLYSEKAPQRCKQLFPGAKIVVLVRNPVDRAVSAYKMFQWFNEMNQDYVWKLFDKYGPEVASAYKGLYTDGVLKSFDDCVKDELERIANKGFEFDVEPSFVSRGMYTPQLKNWLLHIDAENVLIMHNDELRNDTVQSLCKVYDHLDLSVPEFGGIDLKEQHNKGKMEVSPKIETLDLLNQFYEQHNKEFEATWGIRLN